MRKKIRMILLLNLIVLLFLSGCSNRFVSIDKNEKQNNILDNNAIRKIINQSIFLEWDKYLDLTNVNVNESDKMEYSLETIKLTTKYGDKRYEIYTKTKLGEDNLYFISLVDKDGNIVEKNIVNNFDERKVYAPINIIRHTKDNGYIFLYDFNLEFPTEYMLEKFNKDMNFEWANMYNGNDNLLRMNNILQTKDNGYILTGYNFFEGKDYDFHIAKLEMDGGIQWLKNFGGSKADIPKIIYQTDDEGYIIAGETESIDGEVKENKGLKDIWVIKLDKDGQLEWQKTFGGSNNDEVNDIFVTKDGGYIIAGTTYSVDGDIINKKGNTDSLVIRLDQSGKVIWKKTIGGTKKEFSSRILEQEGMYILFGSTESNDGDVIGNNGGSDLWVVLLDNSGEIIWQRCFGTSQNEYAGDIIIDDDGYLLGGTYQSKDGQDSKYWLLKIGFENFKAIF